MLQFLSKQLDKNFCRVWIYNVLIITWLCEQILTLSVPNKARKILQNISLFFIEIFTFSFINLIIYSFHHLFQNPITGSYGKSSLNTCNGRHDGRSLSFSFVLFLFLFFFFLSYFFIIFPLWRNKRQRIKHNRISKSKNSN